MIMAGENASENYDDSWRAQHVGRLLGDALRRYDERVAQLMASSDEAPLALSRLAARRQITAAHIHITRHLPLDGARVSQLAHWADMRKQSMSQLVAQCHAWGLVEYRPDPRDARARLVVFTPAGIDWLAAFKAAARQATAELEEAVGPEVATVIRLGLEAYARGV